MVNRKFLAGINYLFPQNSPVYKSISETNPSLIDAKRTVWKFAFRKFAGEKNKNRKKLKYVHDFFFFIIKRIFFELGSFLHSIVEDMQCACKLISPESYTRTKIIPDTKQGIEKSFKEPDSRWEMSRVVFMLPLFAIIAGYKLEGGLIIPPSWLARPGKSGHKFVQKQRIGKLVMHLAWWARLFLPGAPDSYESITFIIAD